MPGSATLTMIFALLFVLGLMGLLLFVLKRLGLAGPGMATMTGVRRLKIVETLPLTPQHRAMILRRDDVEHLVIIGPNGAVIVESEIKKGDIQP